ncbi:hypothetical protein [Nocardioides daejeonensis]|uniref:hypothetical protein n=1 Tax=Nocardioides daejeonensis TaxID=1046556 RepID=UPI000D749627|nr:hypothetical protein [Nocardioides daejeonensis]
MDDEPEYGPVEMLRSARLHLEIYDGFVALFDSPHAMLDVVLGAEEIEHAMQLLCDNFDINLTQADAVLSSPFSA